MFWWNVEDGIFKIRGLDGGYVVEGGIEIEKSLGNSIGNDTIQ